MEDSDYGKKGRENRIFLESLCGRFVRSVVESGCGLGSGGSDSFAPLSSPTASEVYLYTHYPNSLTPIRKSPFAKSYTYNERGERDSLD